MRRNTQTVSDLKTKPTRKSVKKFLLSLEHKKRRADALQLLSLFEKVTKQKPVLWGNNIVGFGSYHYKYASGREGDWFVAGFSPRKANLTLYIMAGFSQYKELLAKLGKHKTGKSCLYIKRLADVDLAILRQLVEDSVAHVSTSQVD